MFAEMKKFVVMMVIVMALVSGCQTAPSSTSTGVLDNQTFMTMWRTYQRCVSGDNLDQLRADVKVLLNSPQSRRSHGDFTVPLPDMILRHVSAQPSRVAADPQAMAAACSLRAADVARQDGKNEVAVELLNDLLRTHSSGDYAYYVQQAKASLQRIQPTAVYVSQPAAAGSVSRQMHPAPSSKAPRSLSSDAPDQRQYE